jgi:hypothetical protein
MPISLADFTKQNNMSNNRHIWEGWTVNDFIKELEITFPYQNFKTKDDVKQWCKSEQPYYKKHIPEVAKYFIQKAGL